VRAHLIRRNPTDLEFHGVATFVPMMAALDPSYSAAVEVGFKGLTPGDFS